MFDSSVHHNYEKLMIFQSEQLCLESEWQNKLQ